jgi:hypothetical protein
MAKLLTPTRAMLAAIGEVAAECSQVEEELRELYCYLIDSPYGQVILAGETLSNSTLACLRATRYNRSLSNDQLDRIVKIFEAIKLAGPLRNFVVHSRWEKLDKPGQHYGLQSRRATTGPESADVTKGEAWTVQDVKQLAEHFRMIKKAIQNLIDTFTNGPYELLLRRNVAERIEEFFSEMLGSFLPKRPTPSSALEGPI